MMVPPGVSRPARSASSIIRTAIRSLIEFPGLKVSIFASTVASMTPRVMRLMRTIGVLPMTSRMFPATLRTVMGMMLSDRLAARGLAIGGLWRGRLSQIQHDSHGHENQHTANDRVQCQPLVEKDGTEQDRDERFDQAHA